jgi:ABC-2 type transport system ATP-binding protein
LEILLIAVETNGLTKFYGGGAVKALDDVSLSVSSGQIFSLLGPNGAGKTTLVKLLLGIVLPTRGGGKIAGRTIHSHHSHENIGYLAENHRFPEYLTAEQTLRYFGRMSGVRDETLARRIPELLELVNLSGWINQKIRKYSKGMLQRLGIAQALINDPDILFLDEPTDGIDPIGRRKIRDLLISLRNRGKTIFLNSHLLSEVERISDEVAILKNGQLIEKGRVEDFILLKEQFKIKMEGDHSTIFDFCNREKIDIGQSDGQYIIKVSDRGQLNHLIDHLRKNDVEIEAIIPYKISLEDFFIDVLDNGKGSIK